MKVLHAFYDLAVGPVSFDFVVFMVQAEMERVARGADRLHIVIVPDEKGVGGMFRDKTHLYTLDEMYWRLKNICIPAPRLIGATLSVAPSRDWAMDLGSEQLDEMCWPTDWDRQTLKNRRHLIGGVIERKADVPRLHASHRAREAVNRLYRADGRPVVTMTMRSTYMPERNSDPVAWEQARKHIESRGYAVHVIEDTNEALKKFHGLASVHLDLRMACYEEAVLNLQANNGAASLCWFSEQPYRMFGANNNPKEWGGLFVAQGLPLGASWPWARPEQKLVYGKETADTIIEEFEAWVSAARSSDHRLG